MADFAPHGARYAHGQGLPPGGGGGEQVRARPRPSGTEHPAGTLELPPLTPSHPRGARYPHGMRRQSTARRRPPARREDDLLSRPAPFPPPVPACHPSSPCSTTSFLVSPSRTLPPHHHIAGGKARGKEGDGGQRGGAGDPPLHLPTQPRGLLTHRRPRTHDRPYCILTPPLPPAHTRPRAQAKPAMEFMNFGGSNYPAGPHTQGLTLVHVRAQLEHIWDTFMGKVGLSGAQTQLKLS
jgi:hypothetical protein